MRHFYIAINFLGMENNSFKIFVEKHRLLLEEGFKQQLKSRQHSSEAQKKAQKAKTWFFVSWIIFTVWLLVWALGMADTANSFGSFMLYYGSVVLAILLLLSAAAFYWLMSWQAQIKETEETTKPSRYQEILALLIEECFENCHFEAQNEHLETILRNSRLLKINEQIQIIGQNSLSLKNENGNVWVSALALQKKDKKNKLHPSLNGLFIKISLFEAIKYNLLIFSIKNQEQYFENVALNNFVLAESQVKRLAKRADNAISAENIDEFNKNFLLAGRNLNKLDEVMSNQFIEKLHELLNLCRGNIRIEIDNQHLIACLSFANNPLSQAPHSNQFDDFCQLLYKQTEQILQFCRDLECLGDWILETDH